MAIDNIKFDNEIYKIEKAVLVIAKEDDTYVMNLEVYGFDEEITMFMSMFEVPLFNSIDDLDGKVIHVDFEGNRYEDDSLGTDIYSYGEYFESNNFCLKKSGNYFVYNYYEISISFKKQTDNVFDINIDLILHDCNIKPNEAKSNDLKRCIYNLTTKVLNERP